MIYEQLKLDNQLCFYLYASSKAVIKKYKPLLDKHDITYTQYIALLVLWEHGKIHVKDLGVKLHLDSGTLTPLLKRMEQKNIITRRRDEIDERNVYVELTEKGITLRDEAASIPSELLCSIDLDIEDAVELRDRLKFLLDKI